MPLVSLVKSLSSHPLDISNPLPVTTVSPPYGCGLGTATVVSRLFSWVWSRLTPPTHPPTQSPTCGHLRLGAGQQVQHGGVQGVEGQPVAAAEGAATGGARLAARREEAEAEEGQVGEGGGGGDGGRGERRMERRAARKSLAKCETEAEQAP